jgi:hypothetical protein
MPLEDAGQFNALDATNNWRMKGLPCQAKSD